MWLFIQVLWQCSSCTAHRVLCECLFRSFGSAPVVQLIEVCVNVYSGPYGGTEPKNTGPIYRNGIKSMHRNAIKGMHRNAIKVCKWQFLPDFLFCLVKVDVWVTKEVTMIAAILCPAMCMSEVMTKLQWEVEVSNIAILSQKTAEWVVPWSQIWSKKVLLLY